MLTKILLAVGGAFVLAVAVVLMLATTQPDTLRVERATTISAAPRAIYANLDDFKRWAAWSPWEKLDLEMHRSYSGPARGLGAGYAWSGNSDVGSGRMTITEARLNEQLTVKLEFLEPIVATNTAVYSLKPTAAGTEVSWVMDGPSSFASKLMSVFVDMDAVIGTDFEQGLANLRRISEAEASTGAPN